MRGFIFKILPFDFTDDGYFKINQKSWWFHFVMILLALILSEHLFTEVLHSLNDYSSNSFFIKCFSIITIISHPAMVVSCTFLYLKNCKVLCSILNSSVSVSTDLGSPYAFKHVSSSAFKCTFGLTFGAILQMYVILSNMPYSDFFLCASMTVFNYLSFFLEFNCNVFLLNSKEIFKQFNSYFSKCVTLRRVPQGPTKLFDKWLDVDTEMRSCFAIFINLYVVLFFFALVSGLLFGVITMKNYMNLFWTSFLFCKLSAMLAFTAGACFEVNIRCPVFTIP